MIKKANLIIVLFFTILTLSCNNDEQYVKTFESTAEINGFDWRECDSCCGGWLISINGIESNKQFAELPLNTSIDIENSGFPISVQLNWTESEEYCGNGIIIQSIELVE